MSDVIRYVNVGPVVTRKVVTGSSITVNQGSGGEASGIAVNPLIPGLPPDVQGALSELAGKSFVSETASTSLGGHRVIFIDSSGGKYASNDNINHAGLAIGISIGAVNASSQLTIQTKGLIIEPSWNWTSPGLIFLGQNGLLLQSSPGPPALFSQVIGRIISQTKVFIDIQPPLILI
jgi:hypothetical protein